MQFKTPQEFLDHLLDEIKNDRIVLPTLPEVALKVRDAVDKGDATAPQLANLIAEDAALAARLLQIANSPLYRARAEITSLQMAVMRMGYETVRNLMLGLAMKQVFRPTSPLLDRHFHEIWRTSVNVAAISRALATLAPHLNPEQALLAGLIHQIGKLPVLVLADKTPALAKDAEKLEAILNALHPHIGGMIVKTWDFPQALYRAVTEYIDWERQPQTDAADYVDLIQVAYLENVTEDGGEPPVDPSRVGAFTRLGLTPDIETVELEGIDETKDLFA